MLEICRWLQHNQALLAFMSVSWIAVLFEVTHYFGLFLMVGGIVMVDLRIIGVVGRRWEIADLSRQLFPAAWFGLGMVTFSGIMMFTTQALDYYHDPTFHDKMLVTLFAVIFAIIVQKYAPLWGGSPSVPMVAKLVALISIVLLFWSISEGTLVPAISGIG